MAAFQPAKIREGGYALIGVIWLMVFAGSVAAFLLMRASNRMLEVEQQEEFVRARLALEGAIDVIAAERLFGPADSQWRRAGTYHLDIDGISISAEISAEDQRLDINRASAQVIDDELRAAGVSRQTRLQTIGNIAEVRSSGGEIASFFQVSGLLSDAQSETKDCLLDKFTIYNGRTRAAYTEKLFDGPIKNYTLNRLKINNYRSGNIIYIFRQVYNDDYSVKISLFKNKIFC